LICPVCNLLYKLMILGFLLIRFMVCSY
jgi:hypothetical protein